MFKPIIINNIDDLSKRLLTLFNHNFNDDDLYSILECLKSYKLLVGSFLYKQIKRNLEYDVPFDNFIKRLNKLEEFGKNSMTLEVYILRYGDTHGKLMFDNRMENHNPPTINVINKYGDDAKDIFRRSGASLENYIERYGEEEGTRKWNQYLEKRNKTYKIRKEEGRYKGMHSLQKYIDIHGEIVGKELWENKYKRVSYCNSTEYYIEKYGEEEGKQKIKKIKAHTSLEAFINKYGEEEGTEKYDDYRKKKSYTNSIQYYIDRYGEEEGTEKWTSINYKRSNSYNRKGVSLVSVSFFNELINYITNSSITFLINECYYGDNEICIIVKNSICIPDFYYNNCIIEFYGDYWHANPNIFDSKDMIKGVYAEDIWLKDKNRIAKLEQSNYRVLIIWENEVNSNKQEMLEKCVNFLMMK